MFSDYAMPLYSLRSERWNGPDFEKIGFFRWMGYLRHACLPNAHFNHHDINKRGAIHAIRKILKGEEVTISYLPESVYDDHMLPNALEVLMDTSGRTCSCNIHTPEGLAEQASKVNPEIERKDRHLLATGTFTSYTEQMAVAYRIYQVLKDYQIRDVRWARVYELGLEVQSLTVIWLVLLYSHGMLSCIMLCLKVLMEGMAAESRRCTTSRTTLKPILSSRVVILGSHVRPKSLVLGKGTDPMLWLLACFLAGRGKLRHHTS